MKRLFTPEELEALDALPLALRIQLLSMHRDHYGLASTVPGGLPFDGASMPKRLDALPVSVV